MKKILLLGGSAQQVIAIETAKNMGYYTILCDYLSDNPGQYVADKFYLVSTTDKNKVLEIAKQEGIDGIIAYASDPAAPTAAYVAEKIGVATNPYKSVEILCNKDKFRAFLTQNGFHTPYAKGFTTKEEAMREIERYQFPVIIKPVDSSGSKGITVLQNADDLENAIDFAFSYSRNHRIILEEFIEKNHPFLIGGDIFVVNGEVVLWGLMNCHRDTSVNTLVPVGKSYPLAVDKNVENLVHNVLQRLVELLEIKNGAMNVELIVDKNNRVWPIDVGPRNGGNMIPDLLGHIFHLNIVEMSIRAAMGENIVRENNERELYWATYNLHTDKNGIFQGIQFSEQIEPYIIKKCIYKKEGDKVEYFDNAAKAIGIIFMKFDSADKMYKSLNQINTMIHVQVMEVGD